jgi:sigma54-dependent transcription regulator
MATYRVAFDGKWQGRFDDLSSAVEWAQEVAETGRMTWVVEHRRSRLRARLRAAFPEERRDEAEDSGAKEAPATVAPIFR